MVTAFEFAYSRYQSLVADESEEVKFVKQQDEIEMKDGIEGDYKSAGGVRINR